jgi:hypothetical protein
MANESERGIHPALKPQGGFATGLSEKVDRDSSDKDIGQPKRGDGMKNSFSSKRFSKREKCIVSE